MTGKAFDYAPDMPDEETSVDPYFPDENQARIAITEVDGSEIYRTISRRDLGGLVAIAAAGGQGVRVTCHELASLRTIGVALVVSGPDAKGRYWVHLAGPLREIVQ